MHSPDGIYRDNGLFAGRDVTNRGQLAYCCAGRSGVFAPAQNITLCGQRDTQTVVGSNRGHATDPAGVEQGITVEQPPFGDRPIGTECHGMGRSRSNLYDRAQAGRDLALQRLVVAPRHDVPIPLERQRKRPTSCNGNHIVEASGYIGLAQTVHPPRNHRAVVAQCERVLLACSHCNDPAEAWRDLECGNGWFTV